jgi:hypothetical protein
MRRAFAVVLFVALLASVSTGTFLIGSVAAQSGPRIEIFSPTYEVYDLETMSLRYRVEPEYRSNFKVCEVFYFIDGRKNGPLSLNGDYLLKDLSNGYHRLTIFAEAEYYRIAIGTYRVSSNASVGFFVDTGVAPSVSIEASPQYDTNEVSFNISTNVGDSKIFYSLDGQANVSVPEDRLSGDSESCRCSIVLFGVEHGFHTLSVFAKDGMGNTGKAEAAFTVEPNDVLLAEQPFLNVLIAALAIALAVISIVLLFYFRKRKGKRGSQT